MKLTIIIDKDREEEVLLYLHKESVLAEEIRRLVEESEQELIGYQEREAEKITPGEVHCFVVEGNKVYALADGKRLQIKRRLYQLEEQLDQNFIKINQSCIANVRKIKGFHASVGGTLTITFKNGWKDYVSRRNLKKVKERLGL